MWMEKEKKTDSLKKKTGMQSRQGNKFYLPTQKV